MKQFNLQNKDRVNDERKRTRVYRNNRPRELSVNNTGFTEIFIRSCGTRVEVEVNVYATSGRAIKLSTRGGR